jgi:hypothetical protein
MSKMGQAIFQMQEDAYEMTREEFIEKYGENNADIYDQLWDWASPDNP